MKELPSYTPTEADRHGIPIPSALLRLSKDLNHDGRAQYTGLLFPVPTRLEPYLFSMLEVLTNHAGSSRNKMVNELLQVGIEALLLTLPEELALSLQERGEAVMNTALEKNAGHMERGEV